jgi:hypothetical protein
MLVVKRKSMKIISSPNKNWTMKVDCRCGGKLEASRSDFRYVSDSRDGNAIVCKCPICKQDIWIAAELAPGPI